MTKSKEFIRELREQMESKDQAGLPSGGDNVVIYDDVNNNTPTHEEVIDCVKNRKTMLILSESDSMGNITTTVSPVTNFQISAHIEYGITITAYYFIGSTQKQKQLATLNDSEYQEIINALYN